VRAGRSGLPVGTDPTPLWMRADLNQSAVAAVRIKDSAAAPRQSG